MEKSNKPFRLIIGTLSFLTLVFSLNSCTAVGQPTVQIIIENDTIFKQNSPEIYIAVGDLTNDGQQDLVLTTCCDARAAVFQRVGEDRYGGSLLDGPSITVAARPIIAPIRNDGQNWLVYTEHLGGNNGQWLRGHRYEGTTLVENQDVATRVGPPGHHAAGVGDLDQDGAIEIWYVELFGDPIAPTMHLFRRVWDPEARSYIGGEIKDGGVVFENKVRPQSGDFLGDGTESLIWLSQPGVLELVAYTPNDGLDNYISTPIYETSENIVDFHIGEYDDKAGTDIGIITWDGTTSRVHIISGGLFTSKIIGETEEALSIIRMGDTDGNGQAEIYAVGKNGGVYSEGPDGWLQLDLHDGVSWNDGAIMESAVDNKTAVLFAGTIEGTTFQVIAISH